MILTRFILFIILSIFTHGELCGGLNVDIEDSTEISDSFDDIDENSDDNEKLNFVYQNDYDNTFETNELKISFSIQNYIHSLNGYFSIIVPPPEA